MPLKRCSLLQCSCPPRRSVPSKKLGYWYDSGSNTASKHTRKHEDTSLYLSLISTWGKNNEFCLNSNEFGFISDSVSNVGSYKRNTWYNLSCLLQSYCGLSIITKLFLDDSFSRPMAQSAMAVAGGRMSKSEDWRMPLTHTLRQLWQWLEEGCRKPVVSVCHTPLHLCSKSQEWSNTINPTTSR